MSETVKNIRFFLQFIVVITLAIAVIAGQQRCYAEEAPAAGEVKDVMSEVSLTSYLNIEEYEYSKEGRHDPFLPPIEQLAQEQADEEIEILAGMRRFEPEQLTLVAIVGNEKTRAAVVQDKDGKGYTISVGTKIGRGGVVQEIVPNRVVLRMVSYTMAGEERVSTIDMLLRKGED